MTKDEMRRVIIREILEITPEIEEDEIKADANIQRSLEIDSFDFLRILTALNREIGVAVPEADYAKVDTLEKMADYFLANIK